jgi:hypothetical protein
MALKILPRRGMMSEEKPQAKGLANSSKYMKMGLVVITAFLLFAGPYALYALTTLFHVGIISSTIGGAVMVFAGLLLTWFLIRNKVIT